MSQDNWYGNDVPPRRKGIPIWVWLLSGLGLVAFGMFALILIFAVKISREFESEFASMDLTGSDVVAEETVEEIGQRMARSRTRYLQEAIQISDEERQAIDVCLDELRTVLESGDEEAFSELVHKESFARRVRNSGKLSLAAQFGFKREFSEWIAHYFPEPYISDVSVIGFSPCPPPLQGTIAHTYLESYGDWPVAVDWHFEFDNGQARLVDYENVFRQELQSVASAREFSLAYEDQFEDYLLVCDLTGLDEDAVPNEISRLSRVDWLHGMAPHALHTLAWQAIQYGEAQLSLDVLSNNEALEAIPYTHELRAGALLRLDRHDEALAAADTFESLTWKSPHSLSLRLRCLRAADRTEEAVAVMFELAEAFPRQTEVTYELIRKCSDEDLPRLVALVQAADNPAKKAADIAGTLLDWERPDMADTFIQIVREQSDSESGSMLLLALKAKQAFVAGDLTAERKLVDEFIAAIGYGPDYKEPEDPEDSLIPANLMARIKGRWSTFLDADGKLSELVMQSPSPVAALEDTTIDYEEGAFLIPLEEASEATAALRNRCNAEKEADPDWLALADFLEGELMRASRNNEAAWTHFVKVTESHADSGYSWQFGQAISELAIRNGRYAEAAQILLSNDDDLWGFLSGIYEKEGEAAFQKILAELNLPDDEPGVRFYALRALHEEGSQSEALRKLKEYYSELEEAEDYRSYSMRDTLAKWAWSQKRWQSPPDGVDDEDWVRVIANHLQALKTPEAKQEMQVFYDSRLFGRQSEAFRVQLKASNLFGAKDWAGLCDLYREVFAAKSRTAEDVWESRYSYLRNYFQTAVLAEEPPDLIAYFLEHEFSDDQADSRDTFELSLAIKNGDVERAMTLAEKSKDDFDYPSFEGIWQILTTPKWQPMVQKFPPGIFDIRFAYGAYDVDTLLLSAEPRTLTKQEIQDAWGEGGSELAIEDLTKLAGAALNQVSTEVSSPPFDPEAQLWRISNGEDSLLVAFGRSTIPFEAVDFLRCSDEIYSALKNHKFWVEIRSEAGAMYSAEFKKQVEGFQRALAVGFDYAYNDNTIQPAKSAFLEFDESEADESKADTFIGYESASSLQERKTSLASTARQRQLKAYCSGPENDVEAVRITMMQGPLKFRFPITMSVEEVIQSEYRSEFVVTLPDSPLVPPRKRGMKVSVSQYAVVDWRVTD